MTRVCFIARNVHFLPTTSGHNVLSREIIYFLYRHVDTSLIAINNYETLDRELREDPDERYKQILRSIEIIELTDDNKWAESMRRAMVGKRFDIIHVFDLPPAYTLKIWKACRGMNAKLVYHTTMPLKNITGLAKATLLYRIVDAVVSSSPYVFRKNWVAFAKCTIIIPPPVDTLVYKPASDKRPMFKDNFTLFYIGPLEPERFPIRLVIDVVRHLLDINIKLIVAVAPRYEDDIRQVQLLKRVATDRGVSENVQVVYGRMSIESKVSNFRSASAVLFPFLGSYVGAIDPPFTLLESMACGGIAIASDALSLPWVIKNKYNGFLYSTITQIVDIVKIIQNMSADEETKIRNNAVNTIRRYFSGPIIREKLISFYEKLLNR